MIDHEDIIPAMEEEKEESTDFFNINVFEERILKWFMDLSAKHKFDKALNELYIWCLKTSWLARHWESYQTDCEAYITELEKFESEKKIYFNEKQLNDWLMELGKQSLKDYDVSYMILRDD